MLAAALFACTHRVRSVRVYEYVRLFTLQHTLPTQQWRHKISPCTIGQIVSSAIYCRWFVKMSYRTNSKWADKLIRKTASEETDRAWISARNRSHRMSMWENRRLDRVQRATVQMRKSVTQKMAIRFFPDDEWSRMQIYQCHDSHALSSLATVWRVLCGWWHEIHEFVCTEWFSAWHAHTFFRHSSGNG